LSRCAARAVAHSNIALAKYWGKADVARNLTAVPSLSLTLAGLRTITTVAFDRDLGADEGVLGGAPLAGKPLTRVQKLLDRVRALAGTRAFARVESTNDFPTASGLASSASGFAALALAATRAAGLTLSLEEVSALAREASASAARSLFGGFVALEAGAERAERVCAGDYFPLAMVVAVTTAGEKSTGSTDGMQHTAATSPYYPAWVTDAPRVYARVRAALMARDFEALGVAAEQSALAMHASMLAADPAVIYFSPATLAVMHRVRELRRGGLPAFFTMDAGPHVKVLTLPERTQELEVELAAVPGVTRLIVTGPGPDASVELL
jgi:diphosphomevalonate decarboxylase